MASASEIEVLAKQARSVVYDIRDTRPDAGEPAVDTYIDWIVPMSSEQVQPFAELISTFGKGPLVDTRTDQPLPAGELYGIAISVRDLRNRNIAPIICVGPREVIEHVSRPDKIISIRNFSSTVGNRQYIRLDVQGVAHEDIVAYDLPIPHFDDRHVDPYIAKIRNRGSIDGAEKYYFDLRSFEPALSRIPWSWTHHGESDATTFSLVFVECGFPRRGIGGVNVHVPSNGPAEANVLAA